MIDNIIQMVIDAKLKDKVSITKTIGNSKNKEFLYVYAYNYNWSDGFEIPYEILKNSECELSTALMIFYRADGYLYLMDKNSNSNLYQWRSFIQYLYESILFNKYRRGNIQFRPPLSKVQLYKLKKTILDSERVFVEEIEGVSYDIYV